MTDHDVVPDAVSEESGPQDSQSGLGRQIPLLAFGLASVGFLLYLAIGSVEARIWRFNRLYFEDRTIREVWAYFGDHLPDTPGQPVITVLFWISLVVMVAGTVAGLWLFLASPDDDPARPPSGDAAATSHD